jgi:eukaryotic-like serine/threonine-protein kinase
MQKLTPACPACGAELTSRVEGLCPKCLLERAAGIDTADNPNSVEEPSVPCTPFTGTRLRYFGDYELLEEIARGGMGVVFKARQVNLNRLVALKLINSGALASDTIVKRFKAEAEAAAALNHPNIVPIYEIGAVQSQHYFSMALIEGQNLSEFLKANSMDLRQAAELISTIARAVHYAHQHGVLHRDIKPSNILIDKNGIPHLTDFGLAKIAEHDSALTHTNAVLGTPSYMSPEQARGETKQVTTAADIYGLGAALYECLTAQPPFAGGTTLETIRQVLEREPRPPSYWKPGVDIDLDTICLKCLEKEPAKRYASAEAFSDDLGRWLRREPILARRISGIERFTKWTRRRPAAAALTGASLVAIIACVALAISVPAYQKAERARRGEIAARRGEEKQRKTAEATLEALGRADYANNLNLAERELFAGDGSAAERFLDECPPDLRGWEWRYLKHQCYWLHKAGTNSSRVLPSSKPMYGVAFNTAGDVIVAKGGIGLTMYDVANGKEVMSTRTFGLLGRLAVAAGSDRLAVGSPNGDTALLESDGREHVVLTDRKAFDLAFSPDGKLLATAEHKVKGLSRVILWNAASGERLHELAQGKGDFTALAFSPDGKYLAVAEGSLTMFPTRFKWLEPTKTSTGQAIYIWRMDTRSLVHEFKAHEHAVWKLAFTPDSKRLISAGGPYKGGAPGEIKVWDLPTKSEAFQLPGHRECIFSLAISPDGKRLASGGGTFNGTNASDIILWNLDTQKKILSLKGHTAAVNDLAFSPTGDYLASASDDGSIRIWAAIPTPVEQHINLFNYFNADLWDTWHHPYRSTGDRTDTLSELKQGIQRFGEVRFDVRGIIQLKGKNLKMDYPQRILGIQIDSRAEKINFLQATGGVAPNGTQIGSYIVHYADGQLREAAIVYGEHLREWHSNSDPESDITHGSLAWSGRGVKQRNRLFKTSWTNPLPDTTIISVDFVSAMNDCFPFLVAITLE